MLRTDARTDARTGARTGARTDNVKIVYPPQTKFARGIINKGISKQTQKCFICKRFLLFSFDGKIFFIYVRVYAG